GKIPLEESQRAVEFRSSPALTGDTDNGIGLTCHLAQQDVPAAQQDHPRRNRAGSGRLLDAFQEITRDRRGEAIPSEIAGAAVAGIEELTDTEFLTEVETWIEILNGMEGAFLDDLVLPLGYFRVLDRPSIARGRPGPTRIARACLDEDVVQGLRIAAEA